MSDSELINREIRTSRDRSRRFDRLSDEGKRMVLFIANGSAAGLDDIIDDVRADERAEMRAAA